MTDSETNEDNGHFPNCRVTSTDTPNIKVANDDDVEDEEDDFAFLLSHRPDLSPDIQMKREESKLDQFLNSVDVSQTRD